MTDKGLCSVCKEDYILADTEDYEKPMCDGCYSLARTLLLRWIRYLEKKKACKNWKEINIE